MKKLLIVGAGPMGRVAYSYAKDVFSYSMEVKGFLDSRRDVLDGFRGYPSVCSSVEEYEPEEGDLFVVALGDPATKEKYVRLIESKGGKFQSLIHPTAYIGQNVEIGEGSIVAPHVSITNDTTIGNHVLIGLNAVVSHDCQIGDFVSISPGCHITGGCTIHAGSFLGVHSAVIPKCEIGRDAVVYVAAGAIVTKSYDSGRLMGIPAIRR